MQPETANRIARLVASSATRPHGTRARYRGGCKCMLCRAANSRYEVARAAARSAGESNELVSTDPVREHLLRLRKSNVGYKTVGDAAGVSKTNLLRILNGRQTVIRRQSALRVLAIDSGAVNGSALINAGPTWRILDRLIGEGFTKCQIAKWLGYTSPSIQFRRDWITARNAARVERMARLLAAGKLRRDR